MKCYLHIGLQKCGSSSLQRWLTANRADLLEQRILFPNSYGAIGQTFLTAIGMGFVPSHWTVQDTGATTREDYEAWTKRVSAQFQRELSDAAGTIDAVVMSHEDLSTLSKTRVARCMEWLRQYFDEVVVIGYVRPPAELANSWLSQGAKNGLLGQPNAFLDTYNVPLASIAERWAEAANASRWRALSQIKDVVSDFCSVLNLNPGDFKSVPRANTSLSKGAFELLMDLNLPFRINRQNNHNKNMYLDELPVSEPFKTSQAIARAIQDRHAGEIERFLTVAPDVSLDHMQVNYEDYPETFSVNSAPPEYITELQYIIPRLNAQIWLERSTGRLHLAEAMLARRNLPRALELIESAEQLLARSTQVDAASVKTIANRLHERIDRLKERHNLAVQAQTKKP